MTQKTLRFEAFTHKGMREENQDDWRVYSWKTNPATRDLDRGELFMVADGMGGHRQGRLAAIEACDQVIHQYFGASAPNDSDIEKRLKSIFLAVNQGMYQKGRNDPDLSGWACTASVLVIREDRYYFAHSGDTRIYRFSRGKSELLTQDHNIAYQMHLFGKTDYQGYLDAPGHNKLLSYIGQGDAMAVQTGQGRFEETDLFLVCSDGLNQFLEYRDMEEVAALFVPNRTDDPLMDLFAFLKDKKTRPEQSKDNLTFLLVDRGGDPLPDITDEE
jgi:PPM family protein phosphatase